MMHRATDHEGDDQIGGVLLQSGPPALNRVLGATSGPYEGNVRAILVFALTGFFLLLLGFLLVEWVHFGRDEAKDPALAGFGVLIAAMTAITGIYIGQRKAEGA